VLATERSIAIEPHPTRLRYVADNAAALGTPNLRIIAGEAPTDLQEFPPPDAVFIGGALTTDEFLNTCWQALRPGGDWLPMLSQSKASKRSYSGTTSGGER
jgi:precorrin-6Y C5,15-methyltransferase (decarboxylating)